MSNKEMNKVAIRIITKIESLKDVRGPDVALSINVTKEDGLTYQSVVGDWTQELTDEDRLIDFENMIDNMYGTGVWE